MEELNARMFVYLGERENEMRLIRRTFNEYKIYYLMAIASRSLPLLDECDDFDIHL